MTRWVVEHLGPDVPLHFTAFHPDYRMLDVPPTPPATLARARRIALENGLRYVYTGNVHDLEGGSTYCHGCGAPRDRARLVHARRLAPHDDGRCRACGTPCAGASTGRRDVGRAAPAGAAGRLRGAARDPDPSCGGRRDFDPDDPEALAAAVGERRRPGGRRGAAAEGGHRPARRVHLSGPTPGAAYARVRRLHGAHRRRRAIARVTQSPPTH